MPEKQLLQLVREGDLDGFESRCLEGLEAGELTLIQLVAPFKALEESTDRDRVGALGQMVLENVEAQSDPGSALEVARVTLLADPSNQQVRATLVDLYRQVYVEQAGLEPLLEVAGLASGRPARNAIRLLDLCLGLKVDDVLASRTEDAVFKVIDVDLESGLFTLRGNGRPKAIAALELTREYERIDAADFRALRALYPEKVTDLLEADPVAVVIGLLRAHDGLIHQEDLKRELVPQYLDAKSWSKWWTRARTRMKRCPHIVIEGRSPVVLTYCAEGRTLEDETWDAFVGGKDPAGWLALIEGYARQKKSDKEPPDPVLLQRCHDFLVEQISGAQRRRPSEALACALLTEELEEHLGVGGDEGRRRAVPMLAACDDPAALIEPLEDTLWPLALGALCAAREHDTPAFAARLMQVAPAGMLDRILELARQGGQIEAAESYVEMALADPVHYPEMVYWLWKGPERSEGLEIPPRGDLFTLIVRTLSALGRTLTPGSAVTKRFRQRMKAALGLRNLAHVRACLGQVAADRAVTLRRQLELLDGLGEKLCARMVEILRELHPQLWVKPVVRIEPWEDPEVLWNTRAGIGVRTGQRDELVNVKMRENAQRIAEAAAHGDLSENSEYKYALEERDLLRARLAQMNRELSIAQPIESGGVPTDRIGIGSRVTLHQTDSGAVRAITFAGPFDTDVDRGIFNYQAPLSQKLMGLRVGERVELTLEGDSETYEVVEISVGVDAESVVPAAAPAETPAVQLEQ